MYKCSHGTFSRWDNYLNHLGVVHDNGVNVKKFKCEECNRTFFKSSNFKVHCENREPKPCVKCQVICCTKKQLQKHNRKIHPYFKCEKCEKYFSRKILLEDHKSIQLFRNTSCSDCNLNFCTTKQLKIHADSEHKLEEKSADLGASNSENIETSKTCPICFKLFYNDSNVKRHMKTEHDEVGRLKCNYCEQSFSSKSSLEYHEKSQHVKSKLFECEKCCMIFNSISQLYSHKRSNHIKITAVCKHCGKTFKSKWNLKRHEAELHKVKTRLYSDASTKTCPHCSKMFSKSSNLERHVKTKHIIAEEFDCEVCQLNLPSKEMLENHVKSHSVECKADISSKYCPKASKSGGFNAKEKDIEVKCFYCDKFVTSKNMWRHIEEIHGKTKINTAVVDVSAYPYNCDSCTFRTKRKHDLKRHVMQNHSLVEAMFLCEVCDKTFKYESSMKRHAKSHKSDA